MNTGNEIRISVRDLVEYVYRSGDLDSRFVGMGKAIEGTRLHQKIQGLRIGEAADSGETYLKEVSVSMRICHKEITFIVAGRIDGLLKDSEGSTLEEIKTTSSPLENISEDTYPVHWAQAMCYAYMYASEQSEKVINIRLTYYNDDSGEQKVFIRRVSIEELEKHFYEVVEKYYDWAYAACEWSALRNSSIRDLKFPYDKYRKNQRKFAVAVYKTITASKRIFIQAPTGTGKTISALFPTVKALGEGGTEKIFYLTAKTITRQAALDAISKMKCKGLRIKAIVLTAKDKICFKEESDCNPEYCEYAKGYYDKVNKVIKEILEKEDIITRELVEEYAGRHMVCPFELSLDLSYWTDCIICDYNYIFDPRVSLRRFFAEKESNYVLLIDEAHNLVDRAREMFSAELYKKPFLELKRLMKVKAPLISKAAAGINLALLAIKKKSGSRNCCLAKEELRELCHALRVFISRGEEWLGSNYGEQGYREALELYFEAAAFLRVYEIFDEIYTAYIELAGNDVKLKLFCLDPSKLLGEITGRMKASVFYSATLTPLYYFKDILGGSEDDYQMKLASPFEESNLSLTIARNVSTRYTDRESSLSEIVEYIRTAVEARKGKYLIFFPSYKYMNEVFSLFSARYPEIEAIIQQPSMQEKEKESFLQCFSKDTEKELVGFAVMGGMFSEGIDLPGNRLIGAVIVGVGLPQVCFERDIIMDFFKKKNNTGFEYAYMYPGMNKVMQAAGRVIRSESDRGVVVLIDERFGSSRYTCIFPQEWLNNNNVESHEELRRILEKFWSRIE
ncbi:MAG: ATP-dependent DNA helicase [Gracilibacteraceae bacterium]|jgi:DNA excision repair protein ERCC-2|nr:ATP-dependent DNA helicase [Gracilibacteraceae bacterium]